MAFLIVGKSQKSRALAEMFEILGFPGNGEGQELAL
jgi:hypothetical protein